MKTPPQQLAYQGRDSMDQMDAMTRDIDALRGVIRRIQELATDVPEKECEQAALDAIYGECERALSDT